MRGLSGAANNTDLPASFLPGAGESLSELIQEDEPDPLLNWDDVNEVGISIYTYDDVNNTVVPIP